MNKEIKEWAIIGLVVLLSYVSILTPFSLLTIFLLMTPLIILFVKTPIKVFISISVAINFIFILLFGESGFFLFFLFLFFLLPSIAMGYFFKKKTQAASILSIGTVLLIAEFLIVLLISYLNETNLIAEFEMYLSDYFTTMPEQLRELISNNQQEQFVKLIINLIPFYLIIFTLAYSFISYLISNFVLKKTGLNGPGLLAFHLWKLPKFLVWIYFATLFFNLFFTMDSSSTWSMIFLNLLPLLTIAFMIQAFSFIFFIIQVKKWNRMIAIGLIVLSFITPFTILFLILGVVDVLVPIRERIKNNV